MVKSHYYWIDEDGYRHRVDEIWDGHKTIVLPPPVKEERPRAVLEL